MKYTALIKSGVLAMLLGLSFSTMAEETDTFANTGFRGENISILNSSADPVVKLGSNNLSLSNDNSQMDLGFGLLRAIYGEYTNVLCVESGQGSCLNPNDTKGNELKKIANVFPVQTELSQMLANGLMMFSTTILMIQTIIFLMTFVIFLGKGVGKNTSLEEGYHVGVGAVMRVLLSVVLVFPTTVGFSIGIITGLQANALSNQFGTLVLGASLKAISPDQIRKKTEAAVYQQLTSFKNFQMVNDTLADAAYCTAVMNNTLIQSGINSNANDKDKQPNILSLFFHPMGELKRLVNHSFVFGAKTIITDGEIRINFGPTNSPANSLQPAILRNYQYSAEVSDDEEPYFQALSDIDNSVSAYYCGRITVPVSFDLINETNSAKIIASNALAYAEAQAMLMIYNDWLNFFEQTINFSGSDGRITSMKDKSEGKSLSTKLVQKRKLLENRFYEYTYKLVSGGKLQEVYVELNPDNPKLYFPFVQPSNKDMADFFNSYLNLTGKDGQLQIDVNTNPHLQYPLTLLESYMDVIKGDKSIEQLQNNLRLRAKKITQSYLNNAEFIYGKGIAATAMNAVNTVSGNTNFGGQKIQEQLFKDITQRGWIGVGSWVNTIAGISTNFNFVDIPRPNIEVPEYLLKTFSKNDENVMMIGNSKLYGIDRTLVQKFKRYYYPDSNYHSNSNSIRLYNASIAGQIAQAGTNAQPASKMANSFGIAVTQYLGYDPEKRTADQYVHPLLQLQASGGRMMLIGEVLFGISQFSDFGSQSGGLNSDAVDAQMRTFLGNNPDLLGFDSVLSKIITKATMMLRILGVILYFGGAVLAIYLPLLPTIHWISGVLTWIIGGFVNLIAINVMSIGIVLSKGEETLGRAQVGAFMYLENFLRPSLQVIGLLAFLIFSGIFIPLAALLMNEAYLRMATDDVMMTGAVIYVSVSIFLQYYIVVQCSQLITGLHKQVMGHISAQMTVEDQSERTAQQLSGIIQQGRGEMRMMTGGMNSPTGGANAAGSGSSSGATAGLRA